MGLDKFELENGSYKTKTFWSVFELVLAHLELKEVTPGGWQLSRGVEMAHEAATVEFQTQLHWSWNVGQMKQIGAVGDSNKLGWAGEDRHRSSLAEKWRDSRWVAHLQVAFRAIPAGFDAIGWSGGDAGVLCSVEVLLSVDEVAGMRSDEGRKKWEGLSGRETEGRGKELEENNKKNTIISLF